MMNDKDEEHKTVDEIVKAPDKTEETLDELDNLYKSIDEKFDKLATTEDWEKILDKFNKSLLLAFNERDKKLCWYMLEGTGIGMAVGLAVYGIILFICHLLWG